METKITSEAGERTVEDVAISALMRPHLRKHPRPWEVRTDWAPEIIDADKNYIMAVRTEAAAEYIVGLAAAIDSSDAEAEAEHERFMDDGEPAWPHADPDWLH